MSGDGIVRRDWPPVLGGDPEAVEAALCELPGGDRVKLRGGWATIPPSWADGALKGAVSKLPLPEGVLEHMTADMKAMQWRATGEAIILSGDGMLLDGRKRLTACVRADAPFVALILHGVPEDAIETMNNLRGRKLVDILHIQGEVHDRSMSAILPMLWRMRFGTYDRNCAIGSDRQLLALLNAYPKIRESLAYSSHKGRLIRLGTYAALHFLFCHIDPVKGADFHRALMQDGIAVTRKTPEKRLREGHPARALNDFILHHRAANRKLDRNRMVTAAAASLAWRAFMTDMPVKSLAWTPVDAEGNAREFPDLYGWREELDLLPEEPGHQQDAGHLGHEPTDLTQDDPAGVECGHDIMAEFERHPLSDEVWRRAFPDGTVPAVSMRMIGRPEAKALLDRNIANRTKMSATVNRYLRDMEAEYFRSLNGGSIKVAKNGRLLDGQHRMTALETADVRLPFIVVDGLEEHAFEAMDRAETKKFGDILRDRGHANWGTIAAAVKLQWKYEHDQFKTLHGVSISNPEMNDVLKRHPGLAESQEFTHKLRGYMIPTAACWVEYHLKQVDEALARSFLAKLETGEDLKKGDPILVLRNRLHDIELERKTRRRQGVPAKASKEEEDILGERATIRQAALVFIAFNAWRQQRSMSPSALRWRGVEAEGFPVLQTDLLVAQPSRKRKGEEISAVAV